ncbi:MAG: hypothetical protein U1E27_11395, partial [Kiritimatiellia bacterium]|nr:hypothetical protein [Kiritimatiellia bacterium]
ATQWSLPKAESWSIVSGSYFGSSMRSEKSPYWGRVGREPRWDETREGYRNFTMTGWGMSAVASFLFLSFAFLLIADLKRKTLGHFACRSLAVASLTGSVLALMLSWGRHFPLYRLFYALPYFSTIRNPEKWNGPFVLCAVIGGALILDRVWTALRTADRDEMGRLTRALAWAGATLGIAAFAVLVFTITTRDLKLEQLLREDYGALAMRAVEHSVWVSWKTLLLLVAAAAGTLVFLRADRRGKFSAAFWLGGLALLAVGDLLYTNAFFVQPHRYRVLTKPNPLVETLEKAGPDRRLKLLPPRHPLLNNLRLTLLPIPGFDLFDPVSVSRMPDDYAAFFKALESNPIRLWELGAVRFFLSFPDAQAQLDAMDGGRKRFVERAAFGVTVVDGLYVPTAFAAPQDRMLRLLEFTGALPKYRWVPVVESLPATAEGAADILRRMAAPEFDPAETVFVHGEAPSVSQRRGATGIRLLDETPVEARMEVELDSPAFMVRAGRYDSNWEVRADGTPLELLRVNALFQGVVVPAGRHTLVWSYRPPLRPVAVAVAGRLLLLLALLGWVRQGGAPLGGTALENHRLLDAALRSLRERSFGSFL